MSHTKVCRTLGCRSLYNPLNSQQMGSLYTGDKFLFQLPSTIPNFQSQAWVLISLVFMATEHTHTHQCINLLSFTSMSYDIFDQSHTFFMVCIYFPREWKQWILNSFCDDVVFMTIMYNEYDNFAISVFTIACTVIYYTFLQILYSMIMAYLKARTCRCWLPTRNQCCIWHMYWLFHVSTIGCHFKIIIFIFKTFQSFFH